jgi:hypothetical protein
MEKDKDQQSASVENQESANGTDQQTADEEKRKKLGSRKRGVSDMFRTSYRSHIELSAIADNKSNIMISINGIIISIILATISPKLDSNPWLLWPTVAILMTCLTSLVYSIRAARPRVSNEDYDLEDVRANRANILFFGNFYTMDRSEYVEGLEELMMDSERLYDSMARDLHGLGQVLARKYELLKMAYDVFMYGAIISVVCFVIVYISVAW